MPGIDYFLFGHGGPVVGLAINLLVTFVALLAGASIGVPMGIFRATAPFWMQAPVSALLAVIRATPLLLLVLWLFLLLQAVLVVDLPPLWIGCLALGLHAATCISDIVRSGARAVAGGELRAARSLGLSSVQVARHVLVPLATRVMLPALASFASSLFKDSSVCYVIGVVELMQLGTFVATRQPSALLQAYGVVALLFFLVSFAMTRLAHRLERRARVRGLMGAR